MTPGVASRLAEEWRRKLLLSIVVTVGFAAGYLALQRYPMFPVTRMATTRIDGLIPFLPETVYLYESLWLIMPIGPWLMVSKGDLDRYVRSVLIVTIVGFSVFLLFPTSSPRPTDVEHANALYRALVRIDNDGNAFPSLHAALAVLSAASCRLPFRDANLGGWLRLAVWTWAAGIVASTLLTKQHVVVDVVAGVVLGLGAYAIAHANRGDCRHR